MTYIAKLQHFHKSIRKQELHSFFQEKRIALMQHSQHQQATLPSHTSQISENSLMQMEQACHSEEGIQRIYNLNIQDKLQDFLSSQFLQTKGQELASSILCNLYMISRPCPPSKQLTEKVINLLQKGSNNTVSNCVTLIFNIAHDHPSWKQNLVREHNVCTSLNTLLNAQTLSQSSLINILRTVIKLIQKSLVNDSFKCFFPKLIQYLTLCCSDNDIISHAYFCYYHLSLMFPKESLQYNLQHNLLKHFIRISPLLVEVKFTVMTLQLISLTLKSLKESVVTNTIFPYLVILMKQGCKGSKKVKQLIIQIVTDSLVQAKISSQKVTKEQVVKLMLQEFRQQDDPQILYFFVYLFSVVIMNTDISPLTHQVQKLFERVQIICPHQIQTIGFIKQTTFKVKQRLQFQ